MTWVPARRGDEGGFAMIIAVVLMAVIASLATLIMTEGAHTSLATGRGRSWTQAIHVAEAGLQDAIIRLQRDRGATSGEFDGSTGEGTFAYTVTPLGRNRYTIESVGTVAGGAGLGAKRKIRVSMAPPANFKYALFSFTSVDTKNKDHIVGDIWANLNVTVDAGDVVEGSVTAAQGFIRLKNGSHVTKDLWSGHFDDQTSEAIHLEPNAVADGGAKASVSASCTDPQNYTVRLDSGSHITGNVVTYGTKTGSGDVGPPGAVTNNLCTTGPIPRTMPDFTYAPDNYDSSTLHEFGTPSASSSTALSDFQAYVAAHRTDMRGTFTVFQSGAVNQDNRVDLTNIVVTGDLTIITNAPIFSNGASDSTTDAIVVLNSTYQPPAGSACDLNKDFSECTVHLKNNFQSSGATAMLVYSPYGPVAIKNSEIQFGSIYADNIQIKNNQELTYDARVERVVGFEPVTLEVQTWLEIPV